MGSCQGKISKTNSSQILQNRSEYRTSKSMAEAYVQDKIVNTVNQFAICDVQLNSKQPQQITMMIKREDSEKSSEQQDKIQVEQTNINTQQMHFINKNQNIQDINQSIKLIPQNQQINSNQSTKNQPQEQKIINYAQFMQSNAQIAILAQAQQNKTQQQNLIQINQTQQLQQSLNKSVTMCIQSNGELLQKKEENGLNNNFNFSCFICKQQLDYVIYMLPCKHQYHLSCLLNRIANQIEQKEYKIRCTCNQRIHINFLRKVDIQNKLNLITEILNAQAQQLIINNKNIIKNYDQVLDFYQKEKSVQDYYYGKYIDSYILKSDTPGN